MSYETVRKAIDIKIASEWPSTYRITPENFAFTPTEGVAWARYSIRPVNARSADVSGVFRRRTGILWFQLFTPEGKGTIDANKMADSLAAIFDEKTITASDGSTIKFERALLGFIGPDGTGWSLSRCEIGYREDTLA